MISRQAYAEFAIPGAATETLFRLEERLSDDGSWASFLQEGRALIASGSAKALGNLLDRILDRFGVASPILFLLSVFPAIVDRYERLGVDEEVRIATLSDIGLWVRTYGRYHDGATGLDRVHWVSLHASAAIFRLGRLQFEPGSFDEPYTIYRDLEDGRPILLAHADLLCDETGYRTDGDGFFTTTVSSDGKMVVGHPVDTDLGTIERQPKVFDRKRLALLLEQGQPVVHVHVPEGSPLAPSAVSESLSRAASLFFDRLFCCDSWLLDPILASALSPESNSVQFMERFLKFPVLQTEPQIFERVFGFGMDRDAVLHFRCSTSLQRSVVRLLASGRQFHTTGGILVPDLS